MGLPVASYSYGVRFLVTSGRAVALLLFFSGMAAAAVEPATSDATAEKRVALVIGNGAYGDLGNLPNPPNDAADMAKALEDLHFDVISVIDGDSHALKDALKKFHRSALDADMALFYFAGHGMALNGENYMVPVGADIEMDADLPLEALSLNDVQRQLEFTHAPLKMVILDACRNNPLARTLHQDATGRSLRTEEGLARMEVAPASGMLIAYASAPGSVALDGNDQRNSPFTAALLNNIREPKVDARVMFGRVRSEVLARTNSYQMPFVDDSMSGEFEFNPVAPAPEPVLPPADFVEWQRIYNSDDPATFETFLNTYPVSDLANMARDKLASLRDPEGEGRAWEATKARSDIDGYEIFLRRYPSGDFAELASLRLQKLLWGQASSTGDLLALEQFLQRYPDGDYAELAQSKINGLKAGGAKVPDNQVAMQRPTESTEPAEPAPAAPTVTRAAAPPPPPEPVAVEPNPAFPLEKEPQLIQYALSALGFYEGLADGKFGPASERAVSRYQKSMGYTATGKLSAPQVVTLVATAATMGDANSQLAYGLLLARGTETPKDEAQAILWFRKAADSGNGVAQYNLGYAYENGIGVPIDTIRARSFYGAAAVNGIKDAQAAIDKMQD